MQVIGHVFEVPWGILSHAQLLAILAQGRREGIELIAILEEVNLGVEWLSSIDVVVAAGAISVGVVELGSSVLWIILIAGSVKATVLHLWATVRSGLPSPLVSLHEVELRAVVATAHHAIAVAHAISRDPEIAVVLHTGHPGEVES